MKRKITLIVTLLLVLTVFASCEKDYIPDPAVEQYLNSGLSAQKAFDAIASVSYKTVTTVLDKSDKELGKQVSEVHFDVLDKKAVTLTMTNVFSGSLVAEKVTEQKVTLERSGDKYVYKTVTNIESKNSEKEVDEQFALDLVTALVFMDNGAYNSSGLYYGDVFMLKIYRFPAKSFYVDKQADLCVFDEKMLILNDGEMGDVKLYQTTKINRLGLLVSSYEKYESVEQDYVMISDVTASYNYVETTE